MSVGYWGLGLTPADQLDIARTAESLGYDSIWTAEAYGSDAATVLAWLAAQTDEFVQQMESALALVKPKFNEEMRAGHTNM